MNTKNTLAFVVAALFVSGSLVFFHGSAKRLDSARRLLGEREYVYPPEYRVRNIPEELQAFGMTPLRFANASPEYIESLNLLIDWEHKVSGAPGTWIKDTDEFHQQFRGTVGVEIGDSTDLEQLPPHSMDIALNAALSVVLTFAQETTNAQMLKEMRSSGIDVTDGGPDIGSMQERRHRDVWKKIDLETLSLFIYSAREVDTVWRQREHRPAFLSSLPIAGHVLEMSANVVSEDSSSGLFRTYFVVDQAGNMSFPKTYTYEGGVIIFRSGQSSGLGRGSR